MQTTLCSTKVLPKFHKTNICKTRYLHFSPFTIVQKYKVNVLNICFNAYTISMKKLNTYCTHKRNNMYLKLNVLEEKKGIKANENVLTKKGKNYFKNILRWIWIRVLSIVMFAMFA